MKITVQSIQGDPVGELELADELRVSDKGDQAAFESIKNLRAAQRTGAASTKTKAEVAGSGAKPWKQKGLGRARAGYRSSPIWRGGGAAFGPRPHSFRKKTNRKTARLAFRHAFGARLENGEIQVVDELKLSAPKTKEFASVLKTLEADRGALVVLAGRDDHVLLASRNLPNVEVTTAALVNVYQMVRWPRVVMTRAAVEALTARLA
jgi:large subunit ribosomal protein L4